MKKGIHPRYTNTKITCVCGNVVETRSTLGGTMTVEICSNCHPFFTGKQKLIDTAGRVERFRRKYGQNAAGSASPADADNASQTAAATEPPAPSTGNQ